jgi:SAM-dependent methyltransferase
MINVLEHCYDIQKILDVVRQLLRVGGIFVFSDKYYDHNDVSALVQHVYDAGHPLRVDRRVLEEFMSRNFERLHLNAVPVTEALSEETTVRFEEFYFIGRKLGQR